ncbi:TPA: PHP domain-containing protein, partial [Mannheimia haemolytica]|nr:PHP domain-containing protein [Mannheimia haemolytica]
MSDCRFVHLKVHSDFSMINGLAKVKSLVKTAVANNMVAMGLTDFTNFCGLVKFYGEALGAGIKPIIGADVYVRTEAGSEDYFELTLLAKNNKGYHNITQILSKAYQQGYIEFPMVEREWLAELNEGIIILSGGRMGDVGKALLKENRQEAEEKVAFYQQYYPNHFYLSVCRTGRADEERYIKQAVEFSQKNAIPLVAVNDVVLLKED